MRSTNTNNTNYAQRSASRPEISYGSDRVNFARPKEQNLNSGLARNWNESTGNENGVLK